MMRLGLFNKKQPTPEPQNESWVDEIEDFSNFAVGLKMATDSIIEAAVRHDDDLCQKIWSEMTTEQRQYGFWFMLGMIASVIRDQEGYESD